MDAWALVKRVTVKHLAVYLVVAFAIDHALLYLAERMSMFPLFLAWDIGYWIEISMVVGFFWLIVRVFVEIRQG
ncbi:MAG: hypothetical protein AAB480_04385 [Patescibacteria group bacterium]